MKVSSKQYEFFKKCCKEYIELFALGNWEVTYKLETLEQNRCECWFKLGGYVATIYLNEAWRPKGWPLTNKQLRACALHEVVHLLLARLSSNARARYIQETDVRESEEEAVRRVVRAILPDTD